MSGALKDNNLIRKGGNKMRKLVFGTILVAIVMVVPTLTMAQISQIFGRVGGSPPPIVFEPHVVVIPDTDDVYVVPDIDEELFFWNGWWWRPWKGRWYRSRYFDRDWSYYKHVPNFYYDIDPDWRKYYRDRNWNKYRWNYFPIPNRELQRNWNSWYKNRYWEKQRTWDVQKYRPRSQQQRDELRRQRQKQDHQRDGDRDREHDRDPHDYDRGDDYERYNR